MVQWYKQQHQGRVKPSNFNAQMCRQNGDLAAADPHVCRYSCYSCHARLAALPVFTAMPTTGCCLPKTCPLYLCWCCVLWTPFGWKQRRCVVLALCLQQLQPVKVAQSKAYMEHSMHARHQQSKPHHTPPHACTTMRDLPDLKHATSPPCVQPHQLLLLLLLGAQHDHTSRVCGNTTSRACCCC